VYRHDPRDGSTSSCTADRRVGAIIPRRNGGLVAIIPDGIAAIDERSGALERIASPDDQDPATSFNDAKCDAAGRLWSGCLSYDFATQTLSPGTSSFYRFDADGAVTTIFGGVTISNGLDWSPDGKTMYYIDSAEQAVDAFDFDAASGQIAGRRRLVEFDVDPNRPGTLPDGMTVDAEGYLWVAHYGTGSVARFAPDGQPSGRIELPVSQVTSVAFGGSDYRDLYITTGTFTLSPEQLAAQPLAGATFVCQPGVAGLPSHAFAG
jgi:sugar lactone lactonase YvrE